MFRGRVLSSSRLLFGDEAVTDAADGEEVDGFGGVRFEVAAEADEEVIDGAGVGVFVDAPDVFEELFAGDDLAGALEEVAKEIGFHNRQMNGFTGPANFEGIEVDGAVAEGEDGLRGFFGSG